MKWFLVVISLVSTNPNDDRDMWVVQNTYESAGHCSYEANITGLGLMAKAHKEFDYFKKFPEIQPWDAWAVRCVTEEQLMNMVATPKIGA